MKNRTTSRIVVGSSNPNRQGMRVPKDINAVGFEFKVPNPKKMIITQVHVN